MRSIVTFYVATLVGLDIDGVDMQVVQPQYLDDNVAIPKWRKMKTVKTSGNLTTWEWYPQKGVVKDGGWSSAQTATYPKIQMYVVDYNRIMKHSKRELWHVWKETDFFGIGRHGFRVQFPKGIMTYHTKKQAEEVAMKSEANMAIAGEA